MRQNDAPGWGAITSVVLKFRKVAKFESSCIVISSMEKNHLSIKKAVKNLRN